MQEEEYSEIDPVVAEVETAAMENMGPLEQIRYAAKKFNVDMRDPNPNCNHCHGRGYTGTRTSGEPIACRCIYPVMNAATKHAYENRNQTPRNRKEKRYAMKQMKKTNFKR